MARGHRDLRQRDPGVASLSSAPLTLLHGCWACLEQATWVADHSQLALEPEDGLCLLGGKCSRAHCEFIFALLPIA